MSITTKHQLIATSHGSIAVKADYYDGLISRRTRLADYFTEWIEY